MKKLILLFSLLTSISAFSQQKELQNKSEIYEKTDRAAEFPSGMGSFRGEFAKNFDVNKVKGKGQFSTEITFVVERDGSLSSIKATGQNQSLNEQAVRALKKITEKWTPGKVNGIPVRSRFRFPTRVNV